MRSECLICRRLLLLQPYAILQTVMPQSIHTKDDDDFETRKEGNLCSGGGDEDDDDEDDGVSFAAPATSHAYVRRNTRWMDSNYRSIIVIIVIVLYIIVVIVCMIFLVAPHRLAAIQ